MVDRGVGLGAGALVILTGGDREERLKEWVDRDIEQDLPDYEDDPS